MKINLTMKNSVFNKQKIREKNTRIQITIMKELIKKRFKTINKQKINIYNCKKINIIEMKKTIYSKIEIIKIFSKEKNLTH